MRFKQFIIEATKSNSTASLISNTFREICKSLDSEMPFDEGKPEKKRDKMLDFIDIGTLNSARKKAPGGELKDVKSLTFSFKSLYYANIWKSGRGRLTPEYEARDATEEEKLKVHELQIEALKQFMKKADEIGIPVIGFGYDAKRGQEYTPISEFNFEKDFPPPNKDRFRTNITLVFDGEAKAARTINDVIDDIYSELYTLVELKINLKTGGYHWSSNLKPLKDSYATDHSGYHFHTHGTRRVHNNPIRIVPPALYATIEYKKTIDRIQQLLKLHDDEDFHDEVMDERAGEAKLKFEQAIERDNAKVEKLAVKIRELVKKINSPYEIKVYVAPMSNFGKVWDKKTSDYIEATYPHKFLISRVTRITTTNRWTNWDKAFDPLLNLKNIFIQVGDRIDNED